MSLLARSVAWKFQTEDYSFRRSLVPHVHACLQVCMYDYEAAGRQIMWECVVLVLVLGENGSTVDAIRLLEPVVTQYRSKLGKMHPDTLRLVHSLALRYSEAGRGGEALWLLEQVVALRKEVLGEDHPDTLRSMYSLAVRYDRAGQGNKTLQLMKQVVALQANKLGEEHSDTLESMHNMAGRYGEAGRQGEALRLAGQVAEWFERMLSIEDAMMKVVGEGRLKLSACHHYHYSLRVESLEHYMQTLPAAHRLETVV